MWLVLALTLITGSQEGTQAQGAPPPPPPMSVADYGRIVRERAAAAALASAVAESPVPERAFSSPDWWEQNQCGVTPTDTCLRTARNRLAMARVERMEAEDVRPSAPSPRPARPSNCRTVTQASEQGFGGSFTRSCGDGASLERAQEAHRAMMDDLRGRTEPEDQPCDRPLSNETQDQWIGRCRVAPR